MPDSEHDITNDGNDKSSPMLDKLIADTKNKASILLELYLEFFAIFIPGFLLVAGLVALLLIDSSCYKMFKDFFVLEIHHGYKFFLIIIISYAVGSILHRQSPDRPDEISAILAWQRKFCKTDAASSKKYWKYCCNALFRIFPETYIRIARMLCKFCKVPSKKLKFIKYPYDSFRNYLKERGLEHLLGYAPWCTHKEFSNVYRNRGIINEYKTIIKFYGPKVFLQELIRHESNIRMFTSLWHVLKHLIRVWWIIAIITLWRLLHYFGLSRATEFMLANYGTIAIWILILYIMWRAKFGIESTLHYLRLKEIVTILQQVYILEMQSPKNKIWNHIRTRNKHFFAPIKNTDCFFVDNQCHCQTNSDEG